MPTYKTSSDCFIDGTYRKAGSTFTSQTTFPGKLPSYLTFAKKPVTEDTAKKVQFEESQAEIEFNTEKAPDFLGVEDKNLSPQQRAANTRKANAKAAKGKSKTVEVL